MSEAPSVQRAVQVLAILAVMAPATAVTSEHIIGEWQAHWRSTHRRCSSGDYWRQRFSCGTHPQCNRRRRW
jgi:hypothetical protein